MISNVLAICQGNVCRSPMAAALLQQRFSAIKVGSAGLGALVGQPAAAEAVTVMSEVGLDIRGHRATRLTQKIATGADLILAMTAAQVHHVQSLYPVTHGRVFAIHHLDRMDIEDPMGLSVSTFRQCREALMTGIDYWTHRIEVLLGHLNDPTHRRFASVNGGT